DWPSFHWRPSTASTFFSPSCSTRQMPTTGTRVFGSAPAVSLDRSIFIDCTASAGSATATEASSAILMIEAFMSLLRCCKAGMRARYRGCFAAETAPCEGDQERQRGEEPGEGQRVLRVRCDQRIAGIVVGRRGLRRVLAGQAIDERQDLAMAGGAADVGAAGI